MQLPKKLVAARKHSLMVGIVPTELRGHRHRESDAQGRGPPDSHRSKTTHAPADTRQPSHPKHPSTQCMASLLMRKAANGPLSAITNNIHPTTMRLGGYSLEHPKQPETHGRTLFPKYSFTALAPPYYTRGAFSDPEVLGIFQPSGCTVLGGCLKYL